MQQYIGVILALSLSVVVSSSCGENSGAKKNPGKGTPAMSFRKDVFPIIQHNCLPCHAEDSFNPSELSMDSYEDMKAGGKDGSPWVNGNSKESLIIKKLSENPPFGDRMPFNSKKKIADGKARWLTGGEIDTIAAWIDQGAKNN